MFQEEISDALWPVVLAKYERKEALISTVQKLPIRLGRARPAAPVSASAS